MKATIIFLFFIIGFINICVSQIFLNPVNKYTISHFEVESDSYHEFEISDNEKVLFKSELNYLFVYNTNNTYVTNDIIMLHYIYEIRKRFGEILYIDEKNKRMTFAIKIKNWEYYGCLESDITNSSSYFIRLSEKLITDEKLIEN